MNFAQRRRFLWTLFLAGLAILALCAIVANATTLVRLDFDRLVGESVAIARVRCLGSESRWDHGELWTETRFAVIEREKGLLPSVLKVRMLGGSDGALHSHVDGVPTFRAGEEVYLFLWGTNTETYRVLGWSQGAFRIARNKSTGAESVTQDSAADSVFNAKTREFRREGLRNMPVAAFQAKLRQAIAAKN
jgi:hypothetical protein